MYIRGRKRFAPIWKKEGEEGEGGGGGGGSNLTQADVDAAVEAAVSKTEESMAGLKSKNEELLGTVKDLKTSTKAWDGLDPEHVRGMLDKIENDEELKLIAEGKHSEAWEKRQEKLQAKHQSELEGVVGQRDHLTTENESLQAQVRDLIIDQQVITSFAQEKGLESAIPDVVLRAKTAFNIEDGQPIARDANGEIIRGADGAITVPEWVANLKKAAPHLFPGSQGAGAGAGSGSGGGGGSDISSQQLQAAETKDMDSYRKLHRQKQKAARGEA